MTTRCIVLDMDDTLYLERDYVRSGFIAVGDWVHRSLGIPDFFERAWRAFEDGRRRDIFDHCLIGANVRTATVVPEMLAVYRCHQPTIELAPDALRFLERFKGECLALITDGPLHSQQAKARALNLRNWINPLVFTAEHGPDFSKPSVLPFQLVAKALAARATAFWYVADNPSKDFQGPKSLGWQTVRVRRSGGLHCARESTPDVDYEIETLDDLR